MPSPGDPDGNVTIRYKIPVRTWWRLRLLARRRQQLMPVTCDDVLKVGLDTIGVTKDPNELLNATILDAKAESAGLA